jgi:hypothetical protein
VQYVDLELLAGSEYHGLYGIASTGPVLAAATSDRAVVDSSSPSSTWFFASSPSRLTLTNTRRQAIQVTIVGSGQNGKVVVRQTVNLSAGASAPWQLPSHNTAGSVALQIRASAPVVVSGDNGSLVHGLIALQPRWYAMRPSPRSISIFNPAAEPTHVDVRFIGPTVVKSMRLRIAGQHSFALPVTRTRAVVLSADRGVAVGYTGEPQGAAPLLSQPALKTAVTALGKLSRVSVFNPSSQVAHVAITTVGRARAQVVTRELPPDQLYTFVARRPTDAPRGVLITSDVPVVTARVP